MPRTQLLSLLVAAALFLDCTEQNVPTAVMEEPALGQSGASNAMVVCDPTGDAAFKLNTGPGSAKKAPAWQDIVRAEIYKSGQGFVFTMVLAEAVPAMPPMASGSLGWYEWGWALDTDPTTFPAGDPFPKSHAVPWDFFPVVIWDGSAFQAFVVDRRPLLSGEPVIVTPVGFAINGATIRLTVPSSVFGDLPSTFGWGAFTEIRHADWGSNAFENPDGAFFGQGVCP